MGQVVHDENLQGKISSKSDGRGPILEKNRIEQISQAPFQTSPTKIRKKQSQLFANLEIQNLEEQRNKDFILKEPQESPALQDGADPENSQNRTALQDGADPKYLILSPSSANFSAQRHAQDFNHEKDVTQQRKQRLRRLFYGKDFVLQAPPSTMTDKDHFPEKISKECSSKKHGRHASLPWSAATAAPAWPPSQPHALGDRPSAHILRTGGKRPSKQAPAEEAAHKLPRQCATHPA